MERMKTISIAAVALAALALCAASGAQASDFKQFRDWFAACDNLRNCSAYGFDSEFLGGGNSYLRLERGGAADAPVKITITAEVPKGSKFTLRFDDPDLPGLPTEPQTGEEIDGSDDARRVTVSATEELIHSLRKAERILVTRENPPGRTLKDDEKLSSISMSGASAALLWIDDQQKRLDTTTALIRRGAKSPGSMPPQPRPPVIVAAKPAPDAKTPKPSPDLLARARKACDGDANSGGVLAKFEEAYSLAAGLFLYSYSCPEMSGAYNMNSVYFIAPAGPPQAARIVSFRWPVQVGDAEHDGEAITATNSSFDPQTMTLGTFSKGRGIGDCGTEENWVFDGKTFRLAKLKLMSECKGVLSEDWPLVYRAGVKR
jgi:hypothetical protein